MIGQTLRSYRVLDKLGEGGMGEVYRATDTALEREVAIKVLPQAFATDADRVARFAREATLARLAEPSLDCASVGARDRQAARRQRHPPPRHGVGGGRGSRPALDARGDAARRGHRDRAADRRPRWKKRTTRASSTATSSPRTSRSHRTARSKSSTSAWPRSGARTASRRPRPQMR